MVHSTTDSLAARHAVRKGHTQDATPRPLIARFLDLAVQHGVRQHWQGLGFRPVPPAAQPMLPLAGVCGQCPRQCNSKLEGRTGTGRRMPVAAWAVVKLAAEPLAR